MCSPHIVLSRHYETLTHRLSLKNPERIPVLLSSFQLNLKGEFLEIFDHFFGLKDSTWAPYEQAKTFSRTFSISRRYSQKTCGHEVDDYADTVSAQSTTNPTRCQCSQQLCRHRVSIVNDYADTVSADTQFSKIIKLHFRYFFCFYFFQSKIILLTMLTHVCVVIDYADTF